MSDTVKRGISNTAVAVTGIYGLISLIMYVFPAWVPTVMNLVKPMGEFFLTIPIAIIVGGVLIMAPFAILILLMCATEIVAYKLMGLKHS